MTDAPSDPPPAEPTADPAGPTTAGPHAAGPIPQTPSQTRVFRRNPDGPVGGVATGIADYVGIDPTIVKIAVAIAVAIPTRRPVKRPGPRSTATTLTSSSSIRA